ncbi:hypothetical protein ACHWQZ_G004911 [Mnemiopsis leidyi]
MWFGGGEKGKFYKLKDFENTGLALTTYTFVTDGYETLEENSDKEHEENNVVKEQCVPDDDLVYINVSGTIFITTYTCLNSYPNTLLGNEERRRKYYSEKLNAYFFNRHRPCFDSILHYYQTGKEAPPLNVDPDVYAKEKEFFGIKKEREVTVFIPEGDGSDGINCINSCRMKVHNFLQDPRSSSLAAVWHGFDIFFICISIGFLVFESEPQFKRQFTDKDAEYYVPLFVVNCIIMGFFTTDFLIRLVTWPSLLDFWKNLFNVLDILSILPFYVNLMVGGGTEDDKQHYVVLRVCRIFRIVRIFKFVRHSRDLLIIMKAVSNAKRELILLVCLLFIFVITFGSIMYYIEASANKDFDSIMKSCWWVIVTITTVGYGDMCPSSAGGKLFGGFVLTLGIVFLALPMTIIVSKFSFVYEREKM